MPTALVTGAAGFIGSHLTAELLDRGYTVRGVDTFDTGRRRNIKPFVDDASFTLYEADIRDTDAMADCMDGVDELFHQAAVASVPKSINDPVTTTDVNGTGTATVLDAARRADVESVVVASSSAVYGSSATPPIEESQPMNPETPYALSKQYTEQLAIQFAELYDIETVALRYFNVYGPRQDPHGEYAAVIPKFIELILDGNRPTIYGDGEQSRDFVFVADAVQANILAAQRSVSGEVFNVGGGTRMTINELVATLNEVLETNVEPEYDDPRPGDICHSHADISKAQELLEYDPHVAFTAGLERAIEYYNRA